ncbi:mechanosensitive ion channel [soil metagenome]
MTEFFNYHLIEFDGYTLTAKKLLAIIFLVVAARIGLYILKGILLRFFLRKRLDEGRREAIYQLLMYLIWIVTGVAAMELIGIQVTFLIAGSAALLVGLGLGLQQIFQDLVSGIIILLEGIVKINDVIELDGMVGKILSVNLRTSKVLTRDGIIIIVPNHKFIVEKITNWSHHSESTRFKVEVGVAYGSDVEKVQRILLSKAQAHDKILKQGTVTGHGPFVRFVDFGDSALKFELFFWTDDIFSVEYIKSDLRFAIDKDFREHHVVIPFPQRDVHIRTDQPLP